jgi:multiple antibiotic resistance protein
MDSTTTLIGIAATALAGYFAIMNPISNTAVFIGLTAGDDPATKKAIAAKGLLLSFAVIAVVSVAGSLIFSVFGITLASVRITGGIVVFVIGYHMLQGASAAPQSPTEGDVSSSREAQLSIAVSPLAVPMLAGPRNDRYGDELRVPRMASNFDIADGVRLNLPRDLCLFHSVR